MTTAHAHLGLSKGDLSELFLDNKNCLLELAALIIYSQESKSGLSTYYLIAQSTLDFIDKTIDKYGSQVMEYGQKDQFILAGVIYGHYNMALKMGLIIEVVTGNEYQLDPAFKSAIENKVINSDPVCDTTNSLIREMILKTLK